MPPDPVAGIGNRAADFPFGINALSGGSIHRSSMMLSAPLGKSDDVLTEQDKTLPASPAMPPRIHPV